MTSKNPKPDEETDEYVKYNSSVTFTEDVKFHKRLIVAGNIVARNIDAWDIDARNIDARNIDAGNIDAWDIDAWDIDARNIDAWDIDAWDIDAWDINAGNINAGNIICETRKKKDSNSKTIAKVYVKNKSKIERKEHED